MPKKSFTKIDNDLFPYDISHIAFRVYCYLRKCENSKTHKCYPSKQTIADACHMAVSSVSKAIKELEEKALIEIHPTYADIRHQINNTYTFPPLKNGQGVSDNRTGPVSPWHGGCPSIGQEINKQKELKLFNQSDEVIELHQRLLVQCDLNHITNSNWHLLLQKIIGELCTDEFINCNKRRMLHEEILNTLLLISPEAIDRFLSNLGDSESALERPKPYLKACLINAIIDTDFALTIAVHQDTR